MGSSGLEPPTSRLSGARSNRLSYEPMLPSCRSFVLRPVPVQPPLPLQFLSVPPPLRFPSVSLAGFGTFPSLRLPFASLQQRFAAGGGDEEVRTPDPLRARQVLSQLSYTPMFPGARYSLALVSGFEGSPDVPAGRRPSKLNNVFLILPDSDL